LTDYTQTELKAMQEQAIQRAREMQRRSVFQEPGGRNGVGDGVPDAPKIVLEKKTLNDAKAEPQIILEKKNAPAERETVKAAVGGRPEPPARNTRGRPAGTGQRETKSRAPETKGRTQNESKPTPSGNPGNPGTRPGPARQNDYVETVLKRPAKPPPVKDARPGAARQEPGAKPPPEKPAAPPEYPDIEKIFKRRGGPGLPGGFSLGRLLGFPPEQGEHDKDSLLLMSMLMVVMESHDELLMLALIYIMM